MRQEAASSTQSPIRFERIYEAALEDLWALWTTKEGFESWWGPEGFRVEVHEMDPRVGGILDYDMIADAPEQIAYLKRVGMAAAHGTRGTFTRVVHHESLEIEHVIDFIPGLAPYSNRMRVDFAREGERARMTIEVEPHPSPEWTRMSAMGMESQLTKVPAALAART